MGAFFSSDGEAQAIDSAFLVGDIVRVRHLSLKSDSYVPKLLPVGTLGRVRKIDYAGDAYIDFAEMGLEWVYTSNYQNLEKISFPLYECKDLQHKTRICILGGASFQDETSKILVEALAYELEATLGPRAAFITAGMPGVQEIFAKNCGDGARVWNVLPFGEGSNYQVGQDVHAGVDSRERNEIVATYGDIYITVEGGPDVAEQARVVRRRGAPVIPMIRTGGASSGLYNFPPDALQCPAFVTPAKWKLLQTSNCAVDLSVAAAVTVVTAFVASHETKLQNENISEKIKQAEEDLAKVEPYVEEMQKRIADLEDQLEVLTKSKAADAQMLHELAPYKDAHGALKSAYDELAEAHAEGQKRNAMQAEEARVATEAHADNLQKRIADLEEELGTLTKSKAADAQIVHELSSYKDAHGSLKSAYDELAEAHAESQKRHAMQAEEARVATEAHADNLQKRIADLEEELGTLTKSKAADAQIVHELSSYKDAHGALKSAYDEIVEAHAESQKRHAMEAEEARVATEAHADNLQKRIAFLEEELRRVTKSKAADAHMVQELTPYKDAHGALKAAYDELAEAHAESQKSYAKQAEEVRVATEVHVETLQKRVTDLEEELETLTKSKAADAHIVQELTSYRDAHGALKSAYDELSEAHTECQKRHAKQAEEDRVVMESFVERLQRRIEDLEKQLEALKKAKAADAHMVQELASYKDAHEALKSAYDELSEAHAESQKRQADLLKQPVPTEQVPEDLYRRLEEAETARVNADNMVAQLQEKLAAASRKLLEPRPSQGSSSMTLPPASPSMVNGSSSLTLPPAKVSHVVNVDSGNLDGPSMQLGRPQGASALSYQVVQQPVVTVNSAVPAVHAQPASGEPPLISSTAVISPPTSATVIQTGSPVFKVGGGVMTYGGGGTIYAGQATYGGGGGGIVPSGGGGGSMFDMLDTNHDGVITRSEFAAMMR